MYKFSRSPLAAHSIVYLGTNIATSFFSLLTIPILTHFLSPAEYGTMGIYLAVSNGILWCLELGLPIRRLYILNRISPQRLSEDIGIFLSLYLISILPIALLTLLFWETLSAWLPIDLWMMIAALLNGYFLTYLTLSYGLWLISQCALKYAIFKIGLSILNLALVLMGLLYFSLGWQSVALASLISSLILFLLSLRDIIPRFQVRLTLSKEIIRRNLSMLYTIIPLNIALAIVGNAGSILVAYYVNLSESGLYLFALQVTAVIPLFYDGIASAILPYLVSVNTHKPLRHLSRRMLISLYILSVCGLTALLVLVAPYILNWFFPASYSAAIPFIIWLAIARCLGGVSRPISEMVIFKTDRLKQLSAYYFLASLVYLAVTIALLQQYGAPAAGIALILAYLMRIFIIWPYAIRLKHQNNL